LIDEIRLGADQTKITEDDAIQQGAQAFLHKPLDFDKLLKEIKKLFDQSEQQKT
jgi:DNA-binding NtrC family response regulator